MAQLFRLLSVFILAGALPGCSAISAIGDASTPLEVYELRAPADLPTRARALPLDVIVELPTTGGALETDRIMIRPNALQAQYLPGVRWSDETPVMVQTLLLRSLESTGGLRYVGRRPLGSRGDFAIVTELVDFQAEQAAEGEGARVSLRLVSRIVRESDARIVASRTFQAASTIGSTDVDAIVSAFDQATLGLLTEFSNWTLTALAGR